MFRRKIVSVPRRRFHALLGHFHGLPINVDLAWRAWFQELSGKCKQDRMRLIFISVLFLPVSFIGYSCLTLSHILCQAINL